MSDQAGTNGFARAFLPGLVLGIVIGAATTFAFFSLDEGGKVAKPNVTNPDNTGTTSREVGDAAGQDPSAGEADPSGDQDVDPTSDDSGTGNGDDDTSDTPPADGG